MTLFAFCFFERNPTIGSSSIKHGTGTTFAWNKPRIKHDTETTLDGPTRDAILA